MIEQIFGFADRFCGIVRYKWKSLIPATATDKELNTPADKAINSDKGRDSVVDKKLNALADKAVNADKEQNAAASK